MTALCSTVQVCIRRAWMESLSETGSLQGVYNLAGFITTASGQRMAFVQYLLAMQ